MSNKKKLKSRDGATRKSNFNPQNGYVDEWLYDVWDGKKSLGWAPECDLVINKHS